LIINFFHVVFSAIYLFNTNKASNDFILSQRSTQRATVFGFWQVAYDYDTQTLDGMDLAFQAELAQISLICALVNGLICSVVFFFQSHIANQILRRGWAEKACFPHLVLEPYALTDLPTMISLGCYLVGLAYPDPSRIWSLLCAMAFALLMYFRNFFAGVIFLPAPREDEVMRQFVSNRGLATESREDILVLMQYSENKVVEQENYNRRIIEHPVLLSVPNVHLVRNTVFGIRRTIMRQRARLFMSFRLQSGGDLFFLWHRAS